MAYRGLVELRDARVVAETRDGQNVVFEILRVESRAIEPEVANDAGGDAPSDTVDGGRLNRRDMMQQRGVVHDVTGGPSVSQYARPGELLWWQFDGPVESMKDIVRQGDFRNFPDTPGVGHDFDFSGTPGGCFSN